MYEYEENFYDQKKNVEINGFLLCTFKMMYESEENFYDKKEILKSTDFTGRI